VKRNPGQASPPSRISLALNPGYARYARSMKITQDLRDYAATLNDKEQGLSAEAIAKAGMADMSKKFIDMGAEVYVEADKLKVNG
jgi:hypothetical protein